jgi:sulfate adenylyltransferase
LPKPHGGKLIDRILKDKERDKSLNKVSDIPKIFLNREQLSDTENIAKGVYSPLEGFLCSDNYQNVLYEKRLKDDTAWTIPIILDISKEKALEISNKDEAVLIFNNKDVAIINIEEIYNYDKKELAKNVYQTLDEKHPGVLKVFNMKEYLLGGKIGLINEYENPFPKYNLRPMETRILFKEKGWRTVVGFQTRNTPHLGHEYIQKAALTFTDGLFINPVIGRKKKGDFRDDVILKAYEALIKNYYPKDGVVMSIFNTEMRYAGPREAIHHAICRKNFGCTHFIVGRDHAGVGNYYHPYAAQEIFEEFPDLGITPFFFKSFFYCAKCGGIANEKICPHERKDYISFSGTKIRDIFQNRKIPSKEIMRPEVAKVIANFKNPFV